MGLAVGSWPSLWLPIAGAAALVLLLRPRLSLPVILIAALPVLFLDEAPAAIASLAIAAGVGVALGRFGLERTTPVVRTRAAVPTVLFVAYLATSVAWADVPIADSIVALAPSLVLLLGVVAWPMTERGALRILAILGAGQGLLAVGFIVANPAARVTQLGYFAAPLSLVGLFSALALALEGDRRRRSLYVAVFLCAAGVLGAQGRGMLLGGLVGLACTILISICKGNRIQRKRAIRLLLVSLVSLPVILGVAVSMFERLSLSQWTVGFAGRRAEASAALDAWLERPAFGHGMGFRIVNPIAGSENVVNYVHNSLLYFAIVGGVSAAALFVWLVLRLLRCAVRAAYGPWWVGALVALVAYSFTAALQRTVFFNLLIALLGGVLAARVPVEEKAQHVAGADHVDPRTRRGDGNQPALQRARQVSGCEAAPDVPVR